MKTSASALFFTSASATINFMCYASDFGLLECTAADNDVFPN